MTEQPKPYVRFSRDDWGIARQRETALLTEAQFKERSDLLRQIHGGWLVPESDASEVR